MTFLTEERSGGMRRVAVVLLFLSAGAVSCRDTTNARADRERLTAMLRDSVGAQANPNVSAIIDLTVGRPTDSHLQLEFDTVAFANMSDSAFAVRSRELAAFAVRHYTGRRPDSVTVLAHVAIDPRMYNVVRMRSFAVRDLPEQPPPP